MHKIVSSLSAAALTAGFLLLGATGARAGLLAFYPFNTKAATDASGNGNDGSFGPTPPVFTGSGFEGGAFQWDGVTADQFITSPVSLNPSSLPQITFGCWVNAATADAVIRGILSQDNGPFDRTIDVDTRNGGTAKWSAFTGLTGSGVVSGPAVVVGQWTFLAVRHNQNTGDFTFDVDGTRITLSSVVFNDGQATTIGRNPGFDVPFNGLIDNVFIYDQFLSDTQIDAIRAGGENAILGIGSAAPEPGSLALLGMAVPALGLLAARRRQR